MVLLRNRDFRFKLGKSSEKTEFTKYVNEYFEEIFNNVWSENPHFTIMPRKELK